MPNPIRIEIGDKRLIVTVPDVARDDLIALVATFFSRGDERAESRFMQLLPQYDELTLVLTTGSASPPDEPRVAEPGSG